MLSKETEERDENADSDDFEEAGSDDYQELATVERLWAQIASFGHKEALAALGTPLSGLLNWTNRLWKTAEMLLTSFIGASFFLTLTCVGMLIVHKSFSRYFPRTYCTCIWHSESHIFPGRLLMLNPSKRFVLKSCCAGVVES